MDFQSKLIPQATDSYFVSKNNNFSLNGWMTKSNNLIDESFTEHNIGVMYNINSSYTQIE